MLVLHGGRALGGAPALSSSRQGTSMSAAPAPPLDPPAKHAVVCGGGVIGACTALYLVQKGVHVTVVERTGVAAAASGKAGGFLALDWSDGTPLGPLSRASFRLHEELAEELGGGTGYRKVDTLSLRVAEPAGKHRSSRGGAPKAKGGGLLEWVDGPVASMATLGSPSTTAQVHPGLFTQAVMERAMTKYGAKLRIGEVQEVAVAGGAVEGVVVDGGVVKADAVVLALGPWSGRMAALAALCQVTGLKAHSVVLKPAVPEAISAHALFLNYRTAGAGSLEPEIYPRPTGEVYICGMSEETAPLPEDAAQVLPRKSATETLLKIGETVSSALKGAEVETEQACFLPCSEDGLPLIGEMPGAKGLFVATGHSCWGILNAPATGKSLAELIVDGKASTVDLTAFDPKRFTRKR